MSYIYLIGDSNKQKIGVASDPHKRLKQLQTGCPDELTLHYYVEVADDKRFMMEKRIHHELAHKRIRGEWFRFPPQFGIDYLTFAEITWFDKD